MEVGRGKMRRVRVQKVIQDRNHQFISLSSPMEGLEPLPPTVGKQYVLLEDSGKMIKTSVVVRVHENFFETQNSFYKLVVLDQEPFDLSGEGFPQRTQEIQMGLAKPKER